MEDIIKNNSNSTNLIEILLNRIFIPHYQQNNIFIDLNELKNLWKIKEKEIYQLLDNIGDKNRVIDSFQLNIENMLFNLILQIELVHYIENTKELINISFN